MRLSARQWGVIGATAAALSGIAGWEGYRERSYDDGVGVQTVGFGTTRHADGRPVQKGDRLAGAGAELVTTEMVAFEWLRTCEHPDFKQVMGLLK